MNRAPPRNIFQLGLPFQRIADAQHRLLPAYIKVQRPRFLSLGGTPDREKADQKYNES
jgi:hypothetical protein